MFKLVISDDGGKTIIVPLVRDLITIGRQEGSTIRLTERNVSRQHARLTRGESGYRVEDLDSYNGVHVNDQRIEGACDLDEGDRVRVGDYVLALRAEDHATGPATGEGVQSAPGANLSPARLVMVSAPAPGAEFSITKDAVRIGRLEELDLCISHRSISREHAEIRREESGFSLHDVGSANGVRVDGALVKESALRSGDLVDLGQVRFRFIGPGEPYSFEADELAVDGNLDGQSHGKLRTGLILAVVMLVAGALALMEDEGSTGDALQVQAEPLADDPSQPVAGNDGAAIVAQVAAALSGCREHLGRAEFDGAQRSAQNGLLLDETDTDLLDCRDRARRGLREVEAFEQGERAYASGDVDAAYLLFAGLGPDSPLRQRKVVSAVVGAYVRAQLDLAQSKLVTDPREAARIASDVESMDGAPAELVARAESLKRRAIRAASLTKAARPARPRPGPTTPRRLRPSQDPRPTESPAKLARSCLARGDQKCAVKALEGRARTAQELALLIETYRALGDTRRAVRNMHLFVRRYPAAPQADGYKTFIARNNP